MKRHLTVSGKFHKLLDPDPGQFRSPTKRDATLAKSSSARSWVARLDAEPSGKPASVRTSSGISTVTLVIIIGLVGQNHP